MVIESCRYYFCSNILGYLIALTLRRKPLTISSRSPSLLPLHQPSAAAHLPFPQICLLRMFLIKHGPGLVYFAKHDVFIVALCCSMYQFFVSFCVWCLCVVRTYMGLYAHAHICGA